MKKILFVLLTGLLLTACVGKKSCCINIDVKISIKYINQNGKNLFEIPEGLSESEITIYHKVNNKWKLYNESHLDYPKGIRIVKRGSATYLDIFPSTTLVKNNYSETKIQFSDTDFDIIKTEINKSHSNEIVTKVWYNAQLKWQTSQIERMFEIVK